MYVVQTVILLNTKPSVYKYFYFVANDGRDREVASDGRLIEIHGSMVQADFTVLEGQAFLCESNRISKRLIQRSRTEGKRDSKGLGPI